MYFHYFVIISPWKRTGSFIWKNSNHLHPRMFCAKYGWNWSSVSGEEDENVKGLWQRRQLNFDQESTRALGSGELKTTKNDHFEGNPNSFCDLHHESYVLYVVLHLCLHPNIMSWNSGISDPWGTVSRILWVWGLFWCNFTYMPLFLYVVRVENEICIVNNACWLQLKYWIKEYRVLYKCTPNLRYQGNVLIRCYLCI